MAKKGAIVSELTRILQSVEHGECQCTHASVTAACAGATRNAKAPRHSAAHREGRRTNAQILRIDRPVSSKDAAHPGATVVRLRIVLTLHTQEKLGERDKESSGDVKEAKWASGGFQSNGAREVQNMFRADGLNSRSPHPHSSETFCLADAVN